MSGPVAPGGGLIKPAVNSSLASHGILPTPGLALKLPAGIRLYATDHFVRPGETEEIHGGLFDDFAVLPFPLALAYLFLGSMSE